MNFNRPQNLEDRNTETLKEGINFVFKQNPELSQIGTKEQYLEYLNSKNRLYRSEDLLNEEEKGTAPEWLLEQPEIKEMQKATGRWFYKTLEEAMEHVKKFDGNEITFVDIIGDIEKYNAKDNKFNGGYGREGNEYFVSEEIGKLRQTLGSKQDIEDFKNFVSKK